MASTTNTAIAPSFAPAGGGKRGRDGDDGRDRRRPDKPKPIEALVPIDLSPKGALRVMLMLLLTKANLGNVPSGGLLTESKKAKPLAARIALVEDWVGGLMRTPDGFKKARFSELAEAFVHVVRAANTAGLFDQLVALLTEEFTTRAENAANGDDDEDGDSE